MKAIQLKEYIMMITVTLSLLRQLVITITMSSNVIGAFAVLFFTNYSVELYKMVIELSGVQFGPKSYAWFQNRSSALREFDLKSQVWFQTKIARHEVQLPLYYIHFEIAQIQDLVTSNILLMQYWAGLKLNLSTFWGEKVRVLETKVEKFAIWYSLSIIFLQFDWLL